jgi:hypothetical protein
MDTLLRSEKPGKSTQLNSDGKRHDAQFFCAKLQQSPQHFNGFSVE